MSDLSGMTQARWDSISPAERDKARDLNGLNPQLKGYEGRRVEVTYSDGTSERFWVGRSTGWRPCHLAVKTTRSTGGGMASGPYAAVRVVRYNRN